MKLTACVEVWVEFESRNVDDLGSAQRDTAGFVEEALKTKGARIAHVTKTEIMGHNSLREEPGDSHDKLFYSDVCLDNGIF